MRRECNWRCALKDARAEVLAGTTLVTSDGWIWGPCWCFQTGRKSETAHSNSVNVYAHVIPLNSLWNVALCRLLFLMSVYCVSCTMLWENIFLLCWCLNPESWGVWATEITWPQSKEELAEHMMETYNRRLEVIATILSLLYPLLWNWPSSYQPVPSPPSQDTSEISHPHRINRIRGANQNELSEGIIDHHDLMSVGSLGTLLVWTCRC